MYEELVARLATAPREVAIVALPLLLAGLYFGFASLRRYRLIEDVPTALVRSAAQGYVELVGRSVMMPGEPIVAPLSHTQCCWYSFSIERRSGKHWAIVQSGTSDGLFLLRDDTGDCVIDPDGAEVDTLHDRYWFGDHFSGGIPGVHERLDRRSPGLFGRVFGRLHLGFGEYRYHERVLLDNEPLYAIGWFRSLDDSDMAQNRHHLTGEILREWKARPDTLRERFDHNRDGSIDQHEWQDARAAASRLAQEQLAANAHNTHLHTLSKPAGRHFLLANREECALVRRLRWRARLGFGVFLLAALALAVIVSEGLLAG